MILKRHEYHALLSACIAWEAWSQTAVKEVKSAILDTVDSCISERIMFCRKTVHARILIHDLAEIVEQQEKDWKSIWHIEELEAFASLPKIKEILDENLGVVEYRTLREYAGELPPSPWGAVIGAALSSLKGKGFISREIGGVVTEEGEKYLKEAK